MRKTAVEVAGWQKAAARTGLDGSSAAVDELQKNGMEVATLTAAEIAAFREKTARVYDTWAAEIGADLVRAAEQIVARVR